MRLIFCICVFCTLGFSGQTVFQVKDTKGNILFETSDSIKLEEAFTGHRPNKLGGYNDKFNLKTPIMKAVDKAIIPFRFTDIMIISGMALGVDTWAAEYAIQHNIPFQAFVPFEGQEKMWPPASQVYYRELLSKAHVVIKVCPPGYAAWKMQKRNEAMVDICNILIAVWDGTSGGTSNCVQYVKSKGRKIIYINPKELT